jgi:hypothetical protein
MNSLAEISDKIKILKNARSILQAEYEQSDFHKKKEANPHTSSPSRPEDKEIYKLLNAIHEIDIYIKKFQEIQFELLQKQDI